MTLSPTILRRVKQLRAEYVPPMPLTRAVQIARYEEKDWSASEFPFLADFGGYSKDEVTGEVGPFEVHVKRVPDYDSHIGEDDCTGTFHSRETDIYGDEKRPENAVRCGYAGYNGPRDVHWYVPCAATLDLTDYYIKEDRKSRAYIDEIVRAQIQRDMRDDADRSYYGVIATVYLDDEEVGQSSLWGIDSLGNAGESSYFCEVAEDMIHDALDQAHRDLPDAVAKAEAHLAALRSASEVQA